MPAGVALCNARGVHDASTAEWVVAAILGSLRGFPLFTAEQAAGRWSYQATDQLATKTVLIVGYGAIVFTGSGTEHARWLQGYRVDELACQNNANPAIKYCNAPGGAFKFDVTGEVELRR